ncbi:MAG: phosphatidate cytidylyltransferase [Planctomycetia bacterium]|nr:phosphatidate cytidylyltransferase [Planctomycetia bacterium]
MLFWRFIIGVPAILLVALLCWLDANSAIPGLYLLPGFLICVFFICNEILDLLNSGNVFPRRSTVYLGVFSMMFLCWLACHRTFSQVADHGWDTAAVACVLTLLAMASGTIIAFLGEMARYKAPGGNTINLAGAVFIISYIGMLGCFIIMLRIAYGLGAVLSLIIVTKMSDIGAYTVGKIIGRRKLVPGLSPGKTIEGTIGGLFFAILGAWLTLDFIFPVFFHRTTDTSALGLIVFGLLVGATGIVGDLAESLLKRDVGRKDSGRRFPGFGGFLDIFDSLLLAAPVAFGLWAFGFVK